MAQLMENGYKCWRVTSELSSSIDSCPVGNSQECLKVEKDLECKAGYKIVL